MERGDGARKPRYPTLGHGMHHECAGPIRKILCRARQGCPKKPEPWLSPQPPAGSSHQRPRSCAPDVTVCVGLETGRSVPLAGGCCPAPPGLPSCHTSIQPQTDRQTSCADFHAAAAAFPRCWWCVLPSEHPNSLCHPDPRAAGQQESTRPSSDACAGAGRSTRRRTARPLHLVTTYSETF